MSKRRSERSQNKIRRQSGRFFEVGCDQYYDFYEKHYPDTDKAILFIAGFINGFLNHLAYSVEDPKVVRDVIEVLKGILACPKCGEDHNH